MKGCVPKVIDMFHAPTTKSERTMTKWFWDALYCTRTMFFEGSLGSVAKTKYISLKSDHGIEIKYLLFQASHTQAFGCHYSICVFDFDFYSTRPWFNTSRIVSLIEIDSINFISCEIAQQGIRAQIICLSWWAMHLCSYTETDIFTNPILIGMNL